MNKKLILPRVFLSSLVSMLYFCATAQTLNPLSLGTINAGDSIVIYYDVTINTGAGAQVSNQGTITGSNFVSLVTDDPDTGSPNDPTVTLLNMFPLPVRLLDVKAQLSNGAVTVSWNVTNEVDMVRYEVERSLDGRNFSKIGDINASNSSSPRAYSLIDRTPGLGANYYRLRLIDQTAAPKYSAIVRVDTDGKNNSIKLFPNPVTHQALTVQLINLPKGTYEVILYGSAGQVAFKKQIHHEGGSVDKSLILPYTLSKGIYNVAVRTDRTLHSQLVLIQ